jgi:hypothetical protein
MNRRLESRIEQLEKITNPRRTVCIWEDGTGSADCEIAKRKAAGDMDHVEFVIVSWMPPDGTMEVDGSDGAARPFLGRTMPSARWLAAAHRPRRESFNDRVYRPNKNSSSVALRSKDSFSIACASRIRSNRRSSLLACTDGES